MNTPNTNAIERMAMKQRSKRGGKRSGSGRKPGVKNKATVALKEMAGEYTREAVQALVEVMRDPESPPAVKVSAANALLDRSHGKPPVYVEKSEVGITPIPWDELREIRKKSMEKAAQRHRDVIEGRYERLGITKEYQSD